MRIGSLTYRPVERKRRAREFQRSRKNRASLRRRRAEADRIRARRFRGLLP